MVKFFDIRKQDVVRVKRKLNPDQIKRIAHFVEQRNGKIIKYSVEKILKKIKTKKPQLFEVISLGKTEETQTPYANVRCSIEGINCSFCIQERYLKVVIRQPRHPCTNIFV